MRSFPSARRSSRKSGLNGQPSHGLRIISPIWRELLASTEKLIALSWDNSLSLNILFNIAWVLTEITLWSIPRVITLWSFLSYNELGAVHITLWDRSRDSRLRRRHNIGHTRLFLMWVVVEKSWRLPPYCGSPCYLLSNFSLALTNLSIGKLLFSLSFLSYRLRLVMDLANIFFSWQLLYFFLHLIA